MLTDAARPAPPPARRLRMPNLFPPVTATLFALWIVGNLVAPASLAPLNARLHGLVTIFLGIFIEALPFLLLGVLASAALHLFVAPERVQRFSPRHPLPAAIVGASMGLFLLPVCECGSVPATRRLLAKGAPLPLGIAFVLAAPAANPIVVASTWVAFSGDPLMVFGRLGLTLAVATVAGLALGARARPEAVLAPLPPHAGDDHAGCDHGGGRVSAFVGHASAEFFEMGRYLVAGALVAASFQTIVPQETMLALGGGVVVSVLVLMALAIVLSICSTVDAFVALAFAGPFLPGALLAFLVFGPMVDIKSVLLFETTFRRRTVAGLVLLPAGLVLVAAVTINLLTA